MLDDARDAIDKGKNVLQEHVQEIVDVAQKKGRVLAKEGFRLADQAKRQSAGLIALATRHGLNLLEDWADLAMRSVPRRRRRHASPGKFLIGVAALGAVAYYLVSSRRADSPITTEPVL